MRRFLRFCVFAAAAGVIAAATHANVMHAGGYRSQEAPLVVTLAVLLALGMAFVGLAFKDGWRWQAVLLSVLILAGEAYWVLVNADREIARREAQDAPTVLARQDRDNAEARVKTAEAGLGAARVAIVTEAAKKDCLKICAAMLTASETAAQTELRDARLALEKLPRPLSVSPLAERLGLAPWLWDLIMAGLRSLAVVGASLTIGMVLHPRRHALAAEIVVEEASARLPRHAKRVVPKTADIRIRLNKREHVSRFLRAANFRPDPLGTASLKTLHARYKDWPQDERLSAAELGVELRSIINSLGLKCERSGQDVIVYGAAISDQISVTTTASSPG